MTGIRARKYTEKHTKNNRHIKLTPVCVCSPQTFTAGSVAHARKKKTGRTVSLIHFARKTFPINPFDAPATCTERKHVAAGGSIVSHMVFSGICGCSCCSCGSGILPNRSPGTRTAYDRTHARTLSPVGLRTMPVPAHSGKGRHAHN